jgi:hypothetical protein
MSDEEYINEIVQDAQEWSRRNQPPEDEEARTPDRDTWTQMFAEYVKRFGAFIMIILLVYIYGIHQGLLFQQTPADLNITKAQYPPTASVAASSTIDVPVHIYTLVEDERVADERTETSTVQSSQLLRRAAAVWNQAKINFSVVGTTTTTASREDIASFIGTPSESIRDIAPVRSGRVNVFLTPALGGINGVAFRGLEAVAVAEYTTSFDFRVLAHEFGHIFGLEHVDVGGRLMQQGGYGDTISDKEAKAARENARNIQNKR